MSVHSRPRLVLDTNILVTGNRNHLPARWQQTEMVTTRELLDQLGPTLFPPLPSFRHSRRLDVVPRAPTRTPLFHP